MTGTISDIDVIEVSDTDEALSMVCRPPIRFPAICGKCGKETDRTVRMDVMTSSANMAETVASVAGLPMVRTINLPCCRSCAHAHARAIGVTLACLVLGLGSYWLCAWISQFTHVIVPSIIAFFGTCLMMGCFVPGLVIQHKAMPVGVYSRADGNMEVRFRSGPLRAFFSDFLLPMLGDDKLDAENISEKTPLAKLVGGIVTGHKSYDRLVKEAGGLEQADETYAAELMRAYSRENAAGSRSCETCGGEEATVQKWFDWSARETAFRTYHRICRACNTRLRIRSVAAVLAQVVVGLFIFASFATAIGSLLWTLACAFSFWECSPPTLRYAAPTLLGSIALIVGGMKLIGRTTALLIVPASIRSIEKGGFRSVTSLRPEEALGGE